MTIRVILYGLGTVGSGIGQLLLKRSGFAVVGAICTRQEKDGKDLGELFGLEEKIGVVARRDPVAVLQSVDADIVLHATRPKLADVYQEIALVLQSGLDVLTTTEEAAYPWDSHPGEAANLDALAREHGVTLLGTGVNPGFIWDTLVIVLTFICSHVEEIIATRKADISKLSPSVLEQFGVSLMPEEFRDRVTTGQVLGHIGSPESLKLIAHALGWRSIEIEQSLEPIVVAEPRSGTHIRVLAGQVAGLRQITRAKRDGKVVVTLNLVPELAPTGSFDEITIRGSQSITCRIEPAVEPIASVQAMAVNMIPRVIHARAGFLTMVDLFNWKQVVGGLKGQS